jgi:hypothetical protein
MPAQCRVSMIDIGTHHLTVKKQEGERMCAPGLHQKTAAQRAEPHAHDHLGGRSLDLRVVAVRVISRAYQIVLAVKLARHSSFSPFFRQPPALLVEKIC